METTKIAPTRLMSSKLCTLIILITCLGLSGCITSPFYGQKFASKSDEIPFTVWTYDKSKPVTIECAKASAHGGPFNGPSSYQSVASIMPDNQGMLDSKGSTVYAASIKKALPANCWRYYNYPDQYDYITVIRVLQDGKDNTVFTFDKAGLACLGEKIGMSISWSGGLSCIKRYSNTNKPIHTVFLKAKF
jgi:hypothetical protein